MKRQSLQKILADLKENGGFNQAAWSTKQKITYIMSNFYCSKKLAEKVARHI